MKRYAILTLSGLCQDSADPVRGLPRKEGAEFSTG